MEDGSLLPEAPTVDVNMHPERKLLPGVEGCIYSSRLSQENRSHYLGISGKREFNTRNSVF